MVIAASGNAVKVQILYREQFPERVVPISSTFTSTVQRFGSCTTQMARRVAGVYHASRITFSAFTVTKVGFTKYIHESDLYVFFDTIQCQCQISCMIIVFVVAFLLFHFHLLFISIDHGPE
jgi:hypothetical protein